MDKYYTPEIEEFHVGFEWEEHRASGEWFKSGNIGVPMHWGLDNKEAFRVKHLDRSDIEGEGWSNEGLMSPNDTWLEDDRTDCWMYYVDETLDKEKYYQLFISKGKVHIEYHEYQNSVGRTEETLFKGTIKNLSEFRRILKQIGV
jgi:hypothetical protein